MSEAETLPNRDETEAVVDSDDTGTNDLSVFRPPISLGRSDVHQLIKCMQDGTDDVRSTLLHGCKLIYECKVCGSLFRGLPNFLAHKQVFCMNKEPGDTFLLGPCAADLSTVFVEPCGPESDEDGTLRKRKASEIYKDIENTLKVERHQQKEVVIKLERIDSNKSAVLQERVAGPRPRSDLRPTPPVTVTDNVGGTKLTTVTEQVHRRQRLYTSSKTSGRSLLKAKSAFRNIQCKEMFKNIGFCDVKRLRCTKCNIAYQSFKSLKRHMFMKHKESAAASNYHCPKCKCPFSTWWNLTRHMMRRHKVSDKELESYKEKTLEKRMKITASFHDKFSKSSSSDHVDVADRPREANIPDNTGSPTTANTHVQLISMPDNNFKMDLSGITFQQGFSLSTCPTCKKVFGKQESYERHKQVCSHSVPVNDVRYTDKATVNCAKRTGQGEPQLCMECDSDGESRDSVECRSMPKLSPQTDQSRPPHSKKVHVTKPKKVNKVLNGRASSGKAIKTAASPKINKRELREVRQIINRQENRCNKCGHRSKDPTSLYHHAVMHLGWEKYKCRRCSYMSYNMSDCKNHIRRGHPVWCAGKADLSNFMVVISKDARSEKHRATSTAQRANLRNVITSPKKLNI